MQGEANLERQFIAQYVIAGFVIVCGLCGIFMPPRWNVFSFRKKGLGRFISERLSEEALRRIPRIIGAIMITAGIAICVLTVLGVAIPLGK